MVRFTVSGFYINEGVSEEFVDNKVIGLDNLANCNVNEF